MRPRSMVITEVTFQYSTQMPLVEHVHVVHTFSANTPDNPFRIAVLPRTPARYRHLSDTQSVHSCSENMPHRSHHDLVPSIEPQCRPETLPRSVEQSNRRLGFP